MTRTALESICNEIDSNLAHQKAIDAESILQKYDPPEYLYLKDKYMEFMDNYSALSQAYMKKRKALESKHSSDRPFIMSLGRIGWNTLLGGLLGSCFSPEPYTSITGGALGCGLTIFDEVTHRQMDLSSAWWGALIGGFIGGVFDPANSYVCSYIGAGVGGSLGLTKEFVESEHRRSKQSQRANIPMKKLESQYDADKEALIQTMLKSMEKPYLK